MTNSNSMRAWALVSAMGLSGFAFLMFKQFTGPAMENLTKSPKAPAAVVTTAKELKQTSFENPESLYLINLWALWCEPCREEIPDLVKLQDSLKDKGLSVVFIQMETPENWAEGRQLLESLGAQALGKNRDQTEDFFAKLGSEPPSALPYTFFLKNGEIVGSWIGSRSFFEMELEVRPYFE